MSTAIDTAGLAHALAPASASRTAERRFYLVVSVALLLAVFLGFARTFFLRAWFPEWAAAHAAPERVFDLHGTLFALWYLLLVAQASLITARRVAWHRRLGSAGVGLAILMVVAGVVASFVAARRPSGFMNVPVPPLQFLIVPLASIALFAAFVALAIARRRDPQAHKRHLLLASIVMLEAAVARWPFALMDAPSPVPFLDMGALMTDLFLVPLAAWDLYSRGRLHRVTLWGGLIVVASHALRMPIASTDAWQASAGWMLRLFGAS
jgi:hypothetical protein